MGNTQTNIEETAEQKAARAELEKLAAREAKAAPKSDALGARALEVNAHETAHAAISADEQAAFDRGELSDIITDAKPGDDAPWESNPKAKKMDFLVKSPIKGTVQGRKLKLGSIANLELTRDIKDLVRPGVLEAVGNVGRS